MKKDLKNILQNGEGYYIYDSFIPELLCADFCERIKDLYPVRASTSTKIYAEKDDIKNLKDVSVWWSQTVENFEEFNAIKRLIDPLISQNFKNFQFYASDVVTVNSKSEWVSPHVDTPYRFKKWNYNKSLLGIQCILSLQDTDHQSAATGLVPFSQKRDFDIEKCYTGFYDRWFKDNCCQYNMPRGTLLFYNCRVLHSSMPNNSEKDRPALLLNYLDNTIVDEVTEIDNVWSSNGKRP